MSSITLRLVHRPTFTRLMELEMEPDTTVTDMKAKVEERFAEDAKSVKANAVRVIVRKWLVEEKFRGHERLFEIDEKDSLSPISTLGLVDKSVVYVEGEFVSNYEVLVDMLRAANEERRKESSEQKLLMERLMDEMAHMKESHKEILTSLRQIASVGCSSGDVANEVSDAKDKDEKKIIATKDKVSVPADTHGQDTFEQKTIDPFQSSMGAAYADDSSGDDKNTKLGNTGAAPATEAIKDVKHSVSPNQPATSPFPPTVPVSVFGTGASAFGSTATTAFGNKPTSAFGKNPFPKPSSPTSNSGISRDEEYKLPSAPVRALNSTDATSQLAPQVSLSYPSNTSKSAFPITSVTPNAFLTSPTDAFGQTSSKSTGAFNQPATNPFPAANTNSAFGPATQGTSVFGNNVGTKSAFSTSVGGGPWVGASGGNNNINSSGGSNAFNNAQGVGSASGGSVFGKAATASAFASQSSGIFRSSF